HRSLANSRRDSLDGAMTDVTGHKNARLARLQVKRLSIERPPGSPWRPPEIGPGQDIAALVAAQPIADRRRERSRADEDEESLGGQLFFSHRATDDDLLEPILPARLGDRGLGEHRYALVLLDAIDQVARHL